MEKWLGANIIGEALDWLGGVVRSCVPSLSKLYDAFMGMGRLSPFQEHAAAVETDRFPAISLA